MMQAENAHFLTRFLRRNRLLLGFVAALLAACEAPVDEVSKTPDPLGQFRLGHNIAIADHATKGPFSKDFSEDQIEFAIQNAVANRLRRYDGDGLYHLGIVVGTLELAEPSGPANLARQPAMIADVTVYDDSTGRKLNQTPFRIIAGEGFRSTLPIFGSRFVPTTEVQLQNLSTNLARQVEAWLLANPTWFAPRADQLRVPFNTRVLPPDIDTTSINDIDHGAAVN